MWNALGGAVLKSMTDHLLNQANPREARRGDYNIQGHVNNLPINLTVAHSPHGSSPNKSTTGQPSNRNRNAFQNHAGNSKKVNNNQGRKPKAGSFVVVDGKTKNVNNNQVQKAKAGSFVMVDKPKKGNFQSTMRHTESQFSKMKVGAAKGPKPKPKNVSEKSSGTGYTWMYLGRLKLGTIASEVEDHLNERFPGYKFIVEPLSLYRDGKLPCFKVLVNDKVLEEFQKREDWPEGVRITKYHDNFKN